MPQPSSAWRAEPLQWGRGEKIFEAFLEPTCPYSGRAFPKLFELLDRAGEDRLTLKIRLHSQPWHMYSPVVTRAILAASTLPGGKETAKKAFEGVIAHRAEFEFDHHADGPNMDVTPNGLLAHLREVSGVDIAEAFRIPDLDRETRWHTRYARQNGVHVSPTFAIDGLVRSDLSSGDPVEKWLEAVGAA